MNKVFRFSPLVILCVLVGILIWNKVKNRETGPDEFGKLQQFKLIDHNEEVYDSAEIKAKARVVNFMFTQCQGICPVLSSEMLKIQKLFTKKDALELVSISIDPTNDTPENLRKYIKERKIDTSNWSYLTGEKPKIAHIMSEYFKIGFHDDIRSHTERFVLIDRDNQIRGYYMMATDNEAFGRLKKDIAWLLHH